MIQDKLLKDGAKIIVRGFPHTPAMGWLEVIQSKNGMVEFAYFRNEEPDKGRGVELPRHHCEYMIVNKFWTDPDEERERPLANESVLDGLWDEIYQDLRGALTRATPWVEKFDLAQIRQSMHRALDSAFDERLREMKG